MVQNDSAMARTRTPRRAGADLWRARRSNAIAQPPQVEQHTVGTYQVDASGQQPQPLHVPLERGIELASDAGLANNDENRLTSWMHHHLRVITVPDSNANTLDAVETAVLTALNPPLNLAKMPRTATRTALTELRRVHSRN